MASKVIGFRLPVDLAEELERTSREKGVKIADFLRELVDDALYPSQNNRTVAIDDREEDEQSVIKSESIELRVKLEQLTSRLEQLERKRVIDLDRMTALNDMPGLLDRMELLEKSVSALVGDVRGNSDKVQETITKIQEQNNTTERSFDQLRSEVVNLRSQLESSTNRISTVEALKADAAQTSNRLSRVEREAKRMPTDDIEKIELKDGKEHRFRVYKGKTGLVKPHRITIDPIFGDKYIDLTEPLD